MYIFSYCPFLAPKLSLPITVFPLLLGTLSHAEHHPPPCKHRCCPRSLGLLQWQTTPAKCLVFLASSFLPLCLPSSSDRCLLLLKVGYNYELGFLVSVKVETREKRWSQLLSYGAIWMSPPEARLRVANNFVFPSPWGSVCGCARVDIYICTLHSWMYELEEVITVEGFLITRSA